MEYLLSSTESGGLGGGLVMGCICGGVCPITGPVGSYGNCVCATVASCNYVSSFGLVSKSITIGVSSSSIIIGAASFLLVLTGHLSGMSCGTKGFVAPCTAGTFTPLALICDLVCTKMCLLHNSGNLF